MPNEPTPLTDLRELAQLSELQHAALVERGICFIETFTAMAETRPTAMAALLDCSQQDVADFVIAARELVGDSFAGMEAPAIPPFGLIPPTQRAEDERHSEPSKEGDEPCD